MNTARCWLLAYAGAVIAATCIHSPAILSGALLLAVAAAGRQRWQLLKRALLALLAFNLSISLGYVTVSLWQGRFAPDYLLLVNVRALLLVYLGFWLIHRVDPLRALAGWPTAAMFATLAVGQIQAYRRILEEFRLAFRSRNLASPRLRDRARNAGAQGTALVDKSLASAGEVALAMRSRGAFDA